MLIDNIFSLSRITCIGTDTLITVLREEAPKKSLTCSGGCQQHLEQTFLCLVVSGFGLFGFLISGMRVAVAGMMFLSKSQTDNIPLGTPKTHLNPCSNKNKSRRSQEEDKYILIRRRSSKEREKGEIGEKMREKEALVVCSDKSMGTGITVWDMETGDHLLHIPTCASPPHGFLCLRNHFLVASQVQKHGSFGGGAIFIWPLNKPQAPLRSYPIEAIGPLSCTKDGLYLAGGAPSGNAYVWEVSSGKMLKSWRAHQKSLNCLVFSHDNSFLISGSDDGAISIWSMISLLDVADCGNMPSFYRSWFEHQSSITDLLSTSGSSSSVLISSSLDGTCKVWDIILGRLLQTQSFPQAITAIMTDPEEQLLFSGSADGRIFVNTLDIGLEENSFIISEDQVMVLIGHNGSITALSFSTSGLWLISASEDCTACLWDVRSWLVVRRFNHTKGQITNMVVIPRSSLLSMVDNHQRVSYQPRVSLLDKYPQQTNTSRGTVVLLSMHSLLEEDHLNPRFRSHSSMNEQILDFEHERTPAAIQMKVETSVENRLWATSMTKHVTDMNKHLRSRLLDLMQYRLLFSSKVELEGKKKKLKVSPPPPPPPREEEAESPA